MKEETLKTLTPLLNVLRSYPALSEFKTAVFHLDNRDFLHFHDEEDGLYADVRLVKNFVRISVENQAQQAELLERIDQRLSSLNTHAKDRRRRKRRAKPCFR